LAASAAFAGALLAPLQAQLPFTTQKSSGQSVTPAYEGWYRNADGTFTLSFGYYNRNSTEVIGVPIGAQNFVTPGAQNQGQPDTFYPDRHWGVFGVKVPANFGQQKEVEPEKPTRYTLLTALWSIPIRGAHLLTHWQVPTRGNVSNFSLVRLSADRRFQ